jgi:hypothetical protein
MKKSSVGSIIFPRSGTALHYYVFGSAKSGFGVQIVQYCGEQVLQSKFRSHLTCDWLSARNFAHTLARGAVFPDNLDEICEDYQFNRLIHS